MRIMFEWLAPLMSGHQYLDPGSGSFLIQMLLAVLLGAGVAIRIYWRKVKSFFTGKKDVVEPTEEEPAEESAQEESNEPKQ